MKICVFGMWHLGTVTAACLASAGHDVVGLDADAGVVDDLQNGNPPLFEPGLEDLVKAGIDAEQLRFTTDSKDALAEADVVWVTFDTLVDENDIADVDFVKEQVKGLFPYLTDDTIVLISSQLPVKSTAELESDFGTQKKVSFAYSPENLRLGKAINVFMNPDRVVVGTRTEEDAQKIREMFAPITDRIEFMSVESAEMTKHALNAFLATSVVFINEIASICEQVGADAKEVERGLKSEQRIGPRAYLGPGGAFAGGTLARDIMFLQELSSRYDLPAYLFNAVFMSNKNHKMWAFRRIMELAGESATVTILGLTYKPGTDTLRRSSAVELIDKLSDVGVSMRVHDPAVKSLPDDLARKVTLCDSATEALTNANVAVVATEWPDYCELTADMFVDAMEQPLVLDTNRFLGNVLDADSRIAYYTVGRS